MLRSTGRIIHSEGLMRPLPATMPMGFTWSVAIAHTFASACLKIAYLLTRLRIPSNRRPPLEFKIISQTGGRIHVRNQDLLILHILDDITTVGANWAEEDLNTLSKECDKVFSEHRLYRQPSKSSNLNIDVNNTLPFIGWKWDLHDKMLRLDPAKLQTYLRMGATQGLFSQNEPVRLRSLMSRLVWMALAIRPALYFLRNTFVLTQSASNSSRSLRVAARRKISALSSVLPMAHIRPYRGILKTITAFDASNVACGVSFAQTSTRVADFMYDMAARRHVITNLEVQKLYTLVRCLKWRPAFAWKWKRPKHINALEAHTGVLALE